jgi:hypothetical protein
VSLQVCVQTEVVCELALHGRPDHRPEPVHNVALPNCNKYITNYNSCMCLSNTSLQMNPAHEQIEPLSSLPLMTPFTILRMRLRTQTGVSPMLVAVARIYFQT